MKSESVGVENNEVISNDRNKIRKIFIYPDGGILSNFYCRFLYYPPEGYQYVFNEKRLPMFESSQRDNKDIYNQKLPRASLSKLLLRQILNKFFINGRIATCMTIDRVRFGKIPPNTDLIYSTERLMYKKFPWIVDCEHVTSFFGYDISHFERDKKYVESALSSKYCKKIIPWSPAGKRTLIENLNVKDFEHKIETVRITSTIKDFTKEEYIIGDNINLLFIGSANPINIKGVYTKGLREVLKIFKKILCIYDNVYLTIRAWVPKELKLKYNNLKNLKIIEDTLPEEDLGELFKKTDIFLSPSHATLGSAVLDAMSYELPVVALRVWGTPDQVADGKTGFLIEKPDHIPYYVRNFIPNWGTPDFNEAIKIIDEKVIDDFVEKVCVLIENHEMRRKMGKNGREEIEFGKFSINERNKKLKNIYDKIIN